VLEMVGSPSIRWAPLPKLGKRGDHCHGKKDLLRDALKKEGNRLLKKGNELNHPGRRR